MLETLETILSQPVCKNFHRKLKFCMILNIKASFGFLDGVPVMIPSWNGILMSWKNS
jgi:hypothetical protein